MPPTPLNVIGASKVLLLVVIVLVPDVAAKVVVPVSALSVMPAENVRLP